MNIVDCNHAGIYHDKTGKIYYDPALFLEYLGKVTGDDQFIKINTALLEAFPSLQTQKIIADVRKCALLALMLRSGLSIVYFQE